MARGSLQQEPVEGLCIVDTFVECEVKIAFIRDPSYNVNLTYLLLTFESQRLRAGSPRLPSAIWLAEDALINVDYLLSLVHLPSS